MSEGSVLLAFVASTCEAPARRGGRYPGWAPTVAVGLAGRLRCASRGTLARRNSLHSLRSLRSNNRRESDVEARASRPPSVPLRCSPPDKSPTSGTAHRADTPMVFSAGHRGADKAGGGCASAATHAALRRRARTRTVQWTGRAWRAAGPQGPARPARPGLVAARVSALPFLPRRDCSSAANAVSEASFATGHETEHRRGPFAQRRAAASERRRTPTRGFASLDTRQVAERSRRARGPE